MRVQVEKSAIETNFLCPVCPYKHCITKKYKTLVLTIKKTEDDVVNGPKVGGCPFMTSTSVFFGRSCLKLLKN